MSTQIARVALSPLEEWKKQTEHEQNRANLARALAGTGSAPDRFAYTAYMVVARNPSLLAANRQQLWLGVYAAAECGLSLQPTLQQMHLVAFKNEVTPIVGYQGFVHLVSRSGEGLLAVPTVVYQRDVDEGRFRYRQGTRAMVELNPVARNPQAPKGIVRYAFSVFTSRTGVSSFHVMDRDELLEARERSSGWRAYKSGYRKTSPWKEVVDANGTETGDFIAMVKKTLCRHHAKYLPKSTDHWGERIAKAEAVDTAVESGESLGGILDMPFEEEMEKTGTDKLREAVEGEWTEEGK